MASWRRSSPFSSWNHAPSLPHVWPGIPPPLKLTSPSSVCTSPALSVKTTFFRLAMITGFSSGSGRSLSVTGRRLPDMSFASGCFFGSTTRPSLTPIVMLVQSRESTDCSVLSPNIM